MEKYKEVLSLTEQKLWTFDHLIHEDVIGSVREPHLIVTESDKLMVPATIVYQRTDAGIESSFLKERYRKRLYDPFRSIHSKLGQEFDRYKVWDEIDDVSILALPIESNSQVFSAREILLKIMDKNNPLSYGLRRLIEFFPTQNFGIFGSLSLGLNSENSDVDLFIYGGYNYLEATEKLRDTNVQQELGIVPLTKEKIDEYARDYSQSLRISFEGAKRIALLRSRYLLYLGDGLDIKIAISGCFDKEEYQLQTILGSRRIGEVEVEGLVKDIHNSASFPREYVVEVDGKLMRVISLRWLAQRLANENEKMKIRGVLREKDGVEFFSLEKPTDVIIPSVHI